MQNKTTKNNSDKEVNEKFLELMPKIVRKANIAFMDLDADRKEDAVQSVLVSAFMPMNEKHLPSLSIRNYRRLDGLDIDRLGHVNLIVGPNNIGKSSLLETILLWGTKRHFLTIRDILFSRKECHVDNS